MTLDEAIKYYLEAAEEQSRFYSLCPHPCDGTKDCISLKNGKDMGCVKCAAEHRQLAKWLVELKEARRLLKAAVEDVKEMLPYFYSCDGCALNKDNAYECSNSALHCNVKCRWRYADEAMKLLKEEINNDSIQM